MSFCCVLPPLVVKCILVASPGFVKDQFIAYLYKEAVRQDNKVLLENRPKFMLVHSSSGHKYSLKGGAGVLGSTQSHLEMARKNFFWHEETFFFVFFCAEILSDPTVTSRLSDTKVSASACVSHCSGNIGWCCMFTCQAAGEVKALEDFYKMLQHEPDRAFYGWVAVGGAKRKKLQARFRIGRSDNCQPLYLHFLRLAHVEKAADALAIDTLLISDKLFRYIVSLTDLNLLASLLQQRGTTRFYRQIHWRCRWLPRFLLLQCDNKSLGRNQGCQFYVLFGLGH